VACTARFAALPLGRLVSTLRPAVNGDGVVVSTPARSFRIFRRFSLEARMSLVTTWRGSTGNRADTAQRTKFNRTLQSFPAASAP
jgi:hypothetical protein